MGEDENKIGCLVGTKEERNNFKKWWDPLYYLSPISCLYISLFISSLFLLNQTLSPLTLFLIYFHSN